MVKEHKVRLLRKERLAKDVWLFAFEKPEGYIFTPGQYQTFTLSLPNGRTEWRDMTITSSPSHRELWLVTKIREEPSEFKKQLMQLSVGSSIKLEGPSGGFTIRDEKPHVFLSGGIGVNVFYSMIQHANNTKLSLPIVLLASFSHEEELLFFNELTTVAANNTNIKVVYTLTQPSNTWKGEKGRISEDLLQKHVSSIPENIYMIAGGQEFVDAMTLLLRRIRVPQENIRIDYFSGY